mgnify:CR=1 FL=1
MSKSPDNCLEVEKKPFLNALKTLRISIRARQKDEAIISFADGELSIRVQDSVVTVPATGQWSGTAKIVARTLIPIVTFPPDPDPLPLRFVGERFFIAGWSVNGTWHAGELEEPPVGDDATILELVALRGQYSETELESSGLLQQVRDAELTVKEHVAQAVKVLEGIGISEEDVQAIVDEKIEAIGQR